LDHSDASIQAVGALAGSALLLAGILVLRLQWAHKWRLARLGILCGWLLIGAGVAVFARAWGGELGTAYGLLAFSASAYLLITAGVELREPRQTNQREVALEPEERPTNWPRAILKSFLAIVLAGVASIGIGVAFAVAMPIGTHDRIVIGGILVPILWGAGMAWTLSDAKLLRATVLLGVISVAAYAIAFIPRMLPWMLPS
jgi:hypothetical protein